jgi:hypothetical protein
MARRNEAQFAEQRAAVYELRVRGMSMRTIRLAEATAGKGVIPLTRSTGDAATSKAATATRPKDWQTPEPHSNERSVPASYDDAWRKARAEICPGQALWRCTPSNNWRPPRPTGAVYAGRALVVDATRPLPDDLVWCRRPTRCEDVLGHGCEMRP